MSCANDVGIGVVVWDPTVTTVVLGALGFEYFSRLVYRRAKDADLRCRELNNKLVHNTPMNFRWTHVGIRAWINGDKRLWSWRIESVNRESFLNRRWSSE